MSDPTATSTQPAQAPAPSSFIARVALIMGGWTAAHLAVVAALTHAVVPGGWWTFGALLVLLLFALAGILRGWKGDAYPGKLQRLFVSRPFWYAQVHLFPMSVLGALGWLVGLPFGRGALWGQWAALGMGALMAILSVAGWFGSRRLVVRKLDVPFDDLPPDLDGVTIAQLSDLHVGPHTSARFLARVANAVRDAKPHLIVHTGDQVDDYDLDVRRFTEVFGPLQAPLGTYAIAGNHDVYAGWPGVRAGMEAAGMRVLVNDAHTVRHGASDLWIVGTGDPAAASPMTGAPDAAPDLERAMARVPPGAFSLVLAHNPALWPGLAARGARLTLSGHTHHGQLSIPMLRWSLASPFLELSMGEYARGASRLYVHPGTNHWALPLRLGAWPEVALLTLRRKPTADRLHATEA